MEKGFGYDGYLRHGRFLLQKSSFPLIPGPLHVTVFSAGQSEICRRCLLLRLFALLLWMAGLLVLSLVPAPPQIPGPLGWDKLLHGLAYAVLAVLTARLLIQVRGQASGSWWWAWGITVGFGMLIELLQGLAGTGRLAEWGDVGANLVGASLGCLGLRWLVIHGGTGLVRFDKSEK